MLLQVSVVVVGPLSALFQTVPLSGIQWLLVVGLSLVPLVAVELEKRFLDVYKRQVQDCAPVKRTISPVAE